MKMLAMLLLFTGCARSIDGFFDGFSKENKSVSHSKIECYSGSMKFYELETKERVWRSEGGQYEVVEKDKLITTNGDCIVFEYFN